MTKNKVLIVDDEPDIRELLAMTLSRMGIDSEVAQDLSEAHQRLENSSFFLCLADMRLPDGDGIALVEHIQAHYPELPVAVITAYGNVEGAVNTLKAGAFDYVSKPINLTMLRDLVNTALTLSKQNVDEGQSQGGLIGDSQPMKVLKKDISKLARSQAPVFIHGNSGVGKELVANLIHNNGPRSEKAFIPVNCGAIPSELMESEFFGHKKGSFTGAVSDHEGLFQAANGGTLFLDEIAELPLAMQVKLLRAIQEKAIKPVGAHHEVPVDVRILSASHKNLLLEIEKESFRQDLYYRINVIEIRVPTLKERAGDIPLLIDAILKKLTVKGAVPSIDNLALSALKSYAFPGNVRELENILERAMTLCEYNHIKEADLQLPEDKRDVLPSATASDSTEKLESTATETDSGDLDTFLEDQQRDVILKALEQTKWNRTAAAKLLGITFRALRYRLKKLGIE